MRATTAAKRRLASRAWKISATSPAMGFGIGAAVAVPTGILLARVFTSSVEPWDNFIGVAICVIVPGIVAGSVVAVRSRKATSSNEQVPLSLRDCLIFCVPLMLTGAWYAHLFLEHQAQAQIRAIGGSVTWKSGRRVLRIIFYFQINATANVR